MVTDGNSMRLKCAHDLSFSAMTCRSGAMTCRFPPWAGKNFFSDPHLLLAGGLMRVIFSSR